MPIIIFDIEADGLYNDVTKIHCIAWKVSGDDKGVNCATTPDAISSFVCEMFTGNHTLVGHNILGYDIPVLEKMYPKIKNKSKTLDTLIVSRMFNPDRIRGHSLESYSNEVGTEKIKNEDWSVLTENMIQRCKNDVEITYKLYKAFQLQRLDWKCSSLPFRIEHETAKIIAQQVIDGWSFDLDRAVELKQSLEMAIKQIDIEVEPYLKVNTIPGVEVKTPFKKDGKLNERTIKYLGDRDDISGPYSVVTFEPINLGSEKQMKELLLSLGWIPTEYNYKKDFQGKLLKVNGHLVQTSPKLTEDSYDSIPPGLGSKLAERLKCNHRFHQIEGLISNCRPDGRIEAQAITCGSNTARMYHKIVVNIPKAKEGVFLGKEMRELFTSSGNRVLVGCDASALEARCLAHYVNDPLFTKDLLESDIHTVMQNLAGLESRDQGKTLSYAVLYGAGDAKIGRIVNGSETQGKLIRDALYLKCPGLKDLNDRVRESARKRGYVIGIDGRHLMVRNEHSALNVLLQGCGAIVMKYAMILVNSRIKALGLDAFQVGTHHDEFTFECSEKDSEQVARLCEANIRHAGHSLGFNCPLDGEAKIGKTWREIH